MADSTPSATSRSLSPAPTSATRPATDQLRSPLPWLHEDAECDASIDPQGDSERKTTLGLSTGTKEPLSDSATITYESLSPDVQMVVDFALEHGRAETCEYAPPDPFEKLIERIDDAMGDNREIPQHLYIERSETYYEISFRSADQVFYPR
jgi:hypothetical protein